MVDSGCDSRSEMVRNPFLEPKWGMFHRRSEAFSPYFLPPWKTGKSTSNMPWTFRLSTPRPSWMALGTGWSWSAQDHFGPGRWAAASRKFFFLWKKGARNGPFGWNKGHGYPWFPDVSRREFSRNIKPVIFGLFFCFAEYIFLARWCFQRFPNLFFFPPGWYQ